MDLMTDLDDIVKVDLDKTIRHLETIYLNMDLEKNKIFFKELNKTYIVYGIWVNNLHEENNIFLIDIQSNLCSLIHTIMINDKKLANFLLRNTIENALRYITNNLEIRDISELFNKDKFPIESGYKHLILNDLSILKMCYSDLCNYVHSNPEYINSETVDLSKYINFNEDLSECLDIAKKVFYSINNLFKYNYTDIYKSLKINSRSIIDQYTKFEDRITYYRYLSEYKK